MRALCITAPDESCVIDIPMPQINDYQCLVRTRACAICNETDSTIVNHTFTLGSPYWYPLLLGHEGAGEVVEAGKKVTAFAVGDHVINPESHIIKGESEYCPYAGQFVEYTVVTDVAAARKDGVELPKKAYTTKKVSASIPFEDAAAMVALRETMSCIRNINVTPGSSVLIFGDGSNGASLALLARAAGAARVTVAGHHDGRLAHIKDIIGADAVYNTNSVPIGELAAQGSLDFVIDAAGRRDIVVEGSKLVRPGGLFCLYGTLHGEEENINLNSDLASHISFYKNCLPYGTAEIHDELDALVASGRLRPSLTYSHVLPLEQFARALELVRSRRALKAVLTI